MTSKRKSTPRTESRFEPCLELILSLEGGYVNMSADRGGPTNCGIRQMLYDQWQDSLSRPRGPVELIDREDVAKIYQEWFWKASRCGDMPVPLDLALFDASVHTGVPQAIKFLQKVLGATEDGLIGPQTLTAVARCQPVETAKRILNIRRVFYDSIVARQPVQRMFLQGWQARLDRIERSAVWSITKEVHG